MNNHAEYLLAYATRLLGVKTSVEILTATCQEVQRFADVSVVFGSLGSSASWTSGLHFNCSGAAFGRTTPAQRSALFGVHRAVSRERAPVILDDANSTIVRALCGEDAKASCIVLALPIIHQSGRISGLLAICKPDSFSPDAITTLVEFSALAARALDNVQQITSARRDRERLYLLAEAAEEALWDWMPASGEFWWGGGVQTMLGDVVVQSRLSSKFEHIHAEDRERVRASFDHALERIECETWREEYRLQRTDGSWIRVEDHAHILRDSQGVAHRVIGALRDVTELRALLTREREARSEAERANLAKDEFLAMLGHELRNPLSPIVSAVHMLRLGSSPEIVEKGVTIIERQSRHLTRLVDDLLDVSRIAQGKVLLEREHMDMADAVDVALESAQPLIEERRHTVETHILRHLLVDADRARMQQVIGNLITNAAKYTAPGGRIVVESSIVRDMVEVRVTDSGIGIAPEMLSMVFDTFMQVPQELDRRRGGLGLGLAIVRNLVNLHHGTVEAFSEGMGKGSAFVVRLPMAKKAPETRPVLTLVQTETDVAKRVLIVDDNRDAADSLSHALAEVGHAMCVVHDGAAAIQAVKEFRPDVVLLDIGLPVIDGYEVARRLQKQYGSDCPRLVAVTGYGLDNDRKKATAAGFDVHLVKPVQLARVREVIGAL